MGNQLSATATVNVSDISPAYQLVGTLGGGGEGRSFLSSLHCLKPVEHPRAEQSATTGGAGNTSPAGEVTSSASSCAACGESLSSLLLTRSTGSTGEQPELRRWLRQRRAQQQRASGAQENGRNKASLAVSPAQNALSSGGSTSSTNNRDGTPFMAAERLPLSPPASEFNVPRSLLASHSNYLQLLGKDDGYAGDPSPSGEDARMGNALESDARRRTSGSDGHDSGAVAASSSASLLSRRPLHDVVSKVFVRTPSDETQREFIRRIAHMMTALHEHMSVVDGTFPPDTQCGNNILFYDNMQANEGEQFCLLERPFVAYSLPERLVSRPYWLLQERLFTCFQLLKALVQLHEVYGVVHGDIKPSNVLLQSTGWLYLCDLAPFKPNRMPAGNPILFDYYYDTDDSRCCCVAPEKFVSLSLEDIHRTAAASGGDGGGGGGGGTGRGFDEGGGGRGGSSPGEGGSQTSAAAGSRRAAAAAMANLNVHGHTAAMDMFSTACVMFYILTDEPLFRLSDVLELRGRPTREQREALVRPMLQDRGVPAWLIPVFLSLLCAVDANERPTARQLLEDRGREGAGRGGRRDGPCVFPPFYEILYTSVLPLVLSQPADHQAHYLHAHLDSILQTCRAATATATAIDDSSSSSRDTPEPGRGPSGMTDLYVGQLLCPVLCHAIRAAATDEGTFRGLACLHKLLQACCACFDADHAGTETKESRGTKAASVCQPDDDGLLPGGSAMDYNALQHLLFSVCFPHLLFIVNTPLGYSSNSRVLALRTVCEVAAWATAQLCRDDGGGGKAGEPPSQAMSAEKASAGAELAEDDDGGTREEVGPDHHRFASAPHALFDVATAAGGDAVTTLSRSKRGRVVAVPRETESREASSEGSDDYLAGEELAATTVTTGAETVSPHEGETGEPLHAAAESRREEVEEVERGGRRRATAVAADAVSPVPRMHNTTVFDDLLLPCIAELLRRAETESLAVLLELAERLPRLLLAARRCLEVRQTLFSGFRNANKQGTYGGQLNLLLVSGWALCQSLLRPSSPPLVAATVIRQAPLIAAFLGDTRTTDDLIPLLTTATTAALPVRREVFAQAIVLHALLQRPQMKTLYFFLAEGLRQSDVACLVSTLHAVAGVVRAKKFSAWESMTLVHQTLPLVMSPLRLVCLAACHVVVAAATSYRDSEVLAYLSCAVQPLLIQRGVPLSRLSDFLSSFRGGLALASDTVGGGLQAGDLAGGRGGSSLPLQRQEQQRRREVLAAAATAGVGEAVWEGVVDADVVNVLPIPRNAQPRVVDARLQQQLYRALRRIRAPSPRHMDDGGGSEAKEEGTEGGTAAEATRRCLAPCPLHPYRERQRWMAIQSERAALASVTASANSGRRLTLAAAEAVQRRPREGANSAPHRATLANAASAVMSGVTASPFLYHSGLGDGGGGSPAAATFAGPSPYSPPPSASQSGISAPLSGSTAGSTEGFTLHSTPPSSSLPHAPRGRELRPMSVALDSQSLHLGAVTGALSLRHGRLLTVGARGDAMMWQLEESTGSLRYGGGATAPGGYPARASPPEGGDGGASGAVVGRLRLVERAPVMMSSGVEGYTCLCHVAVGARGGAAPASPGLVALGSTDGLVRLLDVSRNTFLSTLTSGEGRGADAGVTALELQQDHVLLASTSDGRLLALDVRDRSQQRPVWCTSLAPELGAPSCLVPLWGLSSPHKGKSSNAGKGSFSMCYGVAAATLSGFACLFDLRFQLCVQHYSLACFDEEGGERTMRTAAGDDDNGRSVGVGGGGGALCACPDLFVDEQLQGRGCVDGKYAAEDPRHWERWGPALLLGMEGGRVLRLFLGSGDLSVAFEPRPTTSPPSLPGSYAGGTSAVCRPPPIRCLLAQPAFGSVFTGSGDGTIRHWLQRTPSASHALCCPPVDPSAAYGRVARQPASAQAARNPPRNYSLLFSPSDARRSHHRHPLHGDYHHPQDLADAYAPPSPPPPPLPRLLHTIQEAGDGAVTRHQPLASGSPMPSPLTGSHLARRPHADAVLTLSVVESTFTGEPLLVSGCRDGTVTVWENGGGPRQARQQT